MASSAPAKSATPETEIRKPSQETFNLIFNKSVSEDKPVLFDYWLGSLDKTVSIGVQQVNGKTEKILFRRDDEYTSAIAHIYGVGQEYVIVTENSIYVVDKAIPVRRISL